MLDDATYCEANAAALYFKTLFGAEFSRKHKHKIQNALLNYGYAIVRSCVIRSVCISGLLTWSGIKHSSQFNQFNLCDDIIEVFRAWVDKCVLEILESKDKNLETWELESITKQDKYLLIENLQTLAKINNQTFPLNRAINHYVQKFKNALLYNQILPQVRFP